MRNLLFYLTVILMIAPAFGQDDIQQSQIKAMLSKIDESKPPVYEGEKDDIDYKKVWLAGYLRHLEKKNALIWEFVQAFPDHERAKPLMEEWFTSLGGGTTPAINERVQKATLELDTLLFHTKVDWILTMGHYYRAYYNLCVVWNRLIFLDSVNAPAEDNERRRYIQAGLLAIEDFTNEHPKELRAVRLFDILAEACHDPISARSIYARIINEYPDHPSKPLYEGKMRRQDKIGDFFVMNFEDALTGDPVDTEQYKGRVVLIVFWANAVQECQKQMKEAKRLWFRYQHEGLEVVDISMDTVNGDGKRGYNNFVKDNKMDWKHYFQGGGLESSFSRSWGVNSLPTWFLLDREGKLRYTDAHRATEEKIKELLKEKS